MSLFNVYRFTRYSAVFNISVNRSVPQLLVRNDRSKSGFSTSKVELKNKNRKNLSHILGHTYCSFSSTMDSIFRFV